MQGGALCSADMGGWRKKGRAKWQVTWWRCSSPPWPSEGAVGFDFRYPTGEAAPSCQDQNGKEEKKNNRYENTEKEEVRKNETERMMSKKKKKKKKTETDYLHSVLHHCSLWEYSSPAYVSGKDSNHTSGTGATPLMCYIATANTVLNSWGHIVGTQQRMHDTWSICKSQNPPRSRGFRGWEEHWNILGEASRIHLSSVNRANASPPSCSSCWQLYCSSD